MDGRGKRKGGLLAWLDDVDEFFADGEHEDFFPEFHGLRFRDAKGPRAAFDVSRVLPHWFDAALEKVDGVFQLQSIEGKRVQDFPERFGGDDVLLHEGETAFVVLRLGVFVVVECPCVLKSWSAEVAYERQSAGDLGVFILRDGA